MLNIEKYKRELMRGVNVCKIEEIVTEITGEKICPTGVDNCNDCKRLIFEWLLEEYKEPILNEAEKNYLSAVIEPFRDKVIYIEKMSSDYYDGEYIVIGIKDDENIVFPVFKENKMYKRMKTEKEYTLEELGL